MQRVQTLLQKLTDMSTKKGETSLIEIDLMMDYTRVLYADLAEIHSRLIFKGREPEEEETHMHLESTQPVQIIKEQPAIANEPVMQPRATEPVITNIPPIQVPVQSLNTQPDIQHAASSIKGMIGINDSYLFVTELFNGDHNAYEYALNKINHSVTYQQAVDWLRANYSWQDDQATETFFNILEGYYKS